MNTPNTHAKYTADMVHTEETIRLYAITQYNLFRKKQKYLTTLASCALIVSGMLIRTDIWPRALLLLIGCVLSTNLYAAPKHIADEVIRRLQGIRCGMRPTSCPDQLAEALTEALEQI